MTNEGKKTVVTKLLKSFKKDESKGPKVDLLSIVKKLSAKKKK